MISTKKLGLWWIIRCIKGDHIFTDFLILGKCDHKIVDRDIGIIFYVSLSAWSSNYWPPIHNKILRACEWFDAMSESPSLIWLDALSAMISMQKFSFGRQNCKRKKIFSLFAIMMKNGCRKLTVLFHVQYVTFLLITSISQKNYHCTNFKSPLEFCQYTKQHLKIAPQIALLF